jgi:hypothetical protein
MDGDVASPYSRKTGNIADFDALWQSDGVRNRIRHRLSVVLGMIAMLGALIALPLTTSMALAMSAPTAASSTADEMPCHKAAKKPAKPCPDCPDVGTCLVKCLQPLSALIAEAGHPGVGAISCVPPAPSVTAAGSLIPPLLRPPSI